MNELKLKLSDLRLRGCGFTLFKVLENNEEEQNVMWSILNALYQKSGMASYSFVLLFSIESSVHGISYYSPVVSRIQ